MVFHKNKLLLCLLFTLILISFQNQTQAQELSLSWKKQLAGIINWSAQILKSGSVLVVASEEGSLYGLEPTTGKTIWIYKPNTRLWTDSITVIEDKLYFSSENGNIYLLDGLTGKLIWQQNIRPDNSQKYHGLESRSKAYFSNKVIYIPTAGLGSYAPINNPKLKAPLIAIDLNGTEQWRFETDNYILRFPYINNDSIYIAGNYLSNKEIEEGGATRIYAINLKTHNLIWQYESEDGLAKSLWANDNSIIFVGYQDYLVSIDSQSGLEKWRKNTGNWVQSFKVYDLLGNTLIYSSANAFLKAVDINTGDIIWDYNIDGVFNYAIGNAILEDNKLYFISQQGDLYAIDANNGQLIWKYPTGLESRDSIAVYNDHIYISSTDGNIYAYKKSR